MIGESMIGDVGIDDANNGRTFHDLRIDEWGNRLNDDGGIDDDGGTKPTQRRWRNRWNCLALLDRTDKVVASGKHELLGMEEMMNQIERPNDGGGGGSGRRRLGFVPR